MGKYDNEVYADTYAVSGLSIEVYVDANDCPSERIKNSKLYVQDTIEWAGNPSYKQCICKCRLSNGLDMTCPAFDGIKQVQRNKSKKFKVLCKALKD